MNAPHIAPLEATSRFASSSTIMGSFPPNSSTTGSRRFAATSATRRPVATLPVDDDFVDRRLNQRRAGRAIAHHHLCQRRIQTCALQQLRQLQRHQRGIFRRLDDHRVAGDQRAQGLNRRSREGIVPRRDDADHPVRLAHQLAALGLHRRVAVRQRLIAQKGMRVADAKLGRIQHHQHLGRKRLDRRLAGFARDQSRQLPRLLAQSRLKFLQDCDSFPDGFSLPRGLRVAGAPPRSAPPQRRRWAIPPALPRWQD